jgi:hypothetical protein
MVQTVNSAAEFFHTQIIQIRQKVLKTRTFRGDLNRQKNLTASESEGFDLSKSEILFWSSCGGNAFSSLFDKSAAWVAINNSAWRLDH